MIDKIKKIKYLRSLDVDYGEFINIIKDEYTNFDVSFLKKLFNI